MYHANATTAARNASRMLEREVAFRGPQSEADTFMLARHMAHLSGGRVDARQVVNGALRAGLRHEPHRDRYAA